MIKKLEKKGYVNYSAYQGTALIPEGLKLGSKIARKHRLLERFLSDILHIKIDKIHAQACQMEHTLSDDAEESLCRFLKHPDTCTDDSNLIPACDLPFSTCEECMEIHSKGLEDGGRRQQNLISICNLKDGDSAKISFIRGEHRVLQRLLDMGITPGTSIKVERVAPLKGPIEVSVRGSKLAIGKDIVSNVFVDSVERNGQNR
ncbi:MAG: DtxR family transcriptional regulator, Mn-dependent transcriptional regulator [Thermoproteota archaeon]|nr:DtxR family transcriptional regulator, Mn-dependent transcriptional regulator [Thermoproteota archaeon]